MILSLQQIINANIADLKLTHQAKLDHLEQMYNYVESPATDVLDKTVFKDIIDKVEEIPDYKFITTMLAIDGCMLYTLLLVQQNFALNIKKDVTSFAEESPKETPETEPLECKKYELTKQYISTEALELDNDKDIYYDAQFDPTRYDTMDVYKTQLESISKDTDKEAFIIQHLQQDIGMTVEQAKEEATALFNTKRQVPEGTYALLISKNTYTYFKRIDNTWVEDTSIPKIPLESNTIFCNIQPKCLMLKSECETVNNIKIPSYIDTLKTFDAAVETEVEAFKAKVSNDITYTTYYYNQVVYIDSVKKLKNNNMYYSLGLQSGENVAPSSPYLELMTAIIGQGDFVKRQHDIMKFVKLYTRTAEDEENPFFRYCLKTSEPLMPTFMVELASTWITSNSTYIQKLDSICFKQGKLSNDGDSWVDEHSGYVIKTIESVSEFSSSGPELVLSNDLFIAPKKRIELDPLLDQVVNAIANKLGINIEKQISDIKTIYTDLIENTSFLKTSKGYTAEVKKRKTKPPADLGIAYNKYATALKIRAAIATFISVLQTAVPNYSSITNNPGCVKDFSGYPLSVKENTGCIKFITCIVKTLISDGEPWKYIRSQRENLEAKIIKDISKIVHNEKYKLLKRKKLAYMQRNPIEEVITKPANQWVHFLPPLTTIDQKSIEPCTTNMLKEVSADMYIGNKEQSNKINIIKGKIQLFSISVLQTISKAISKETTLLSNSFNEPFIENSCCLETHNSGILSYLFGENLTQITTDLTHITTYENILLDIHQLSKPASISFINTIIERTTLEPDYSETIIILAIIKYCNYENYKPVPENLLAICGDKPENYDKLDQFSTKVDKIKANRVPPLSTELLFSMLQLVYKRVDNVPRENIEYGHANVLVDYVTRFANIHNTPADEIINLYLETNLDIAEEYNNAIRDKNLEVQTDILADAQLYYNGQNNVPDSNVLITNQLFLDILETINDDLYSEKVGMLINQLATFNIESKQTIKEIIADQDIRQTKLKKLFKKKKADEPWPFIDELLDWKDNNISNNISWLQYVVYNLTTILPNIIINNYKYENIKIPKYWNLHPSHEMKIKNLVSSEVTGSEFNPFIQFMNKPVLDAWFKRIQLSLEYYLALSKSVIIRETNGMFDEMSSKKLVEYCVLEVCKLYMSETPDDGYRDRVLFIANAMDMFLRTKDNINWSLDEIIYDVNKSKETEKESVIHRLESMSDEEKQLDKEMKNLKLGPWAIDHVTTYNAAEWAKTDNPVESTADIEDANEHDNIDNYLGENGD